LGEGSSQRLTDLVRRWIAAINAQDLDGLVDCFHPEYEDEAPARSGESVRGPEEVRANFERMFAEIPDVAAEVLAVVTDRDEVWMEWRMYGSRSDGSRMEFRGVNIFGVRDGRFARGRIYTELVREAGGIEAQIDRMTKGAGEAGP
jgi:ketosteroid isomerase-like protein